MMIIVTLIIGIGIGYTLASNQYTNNLHKILNNVEDLRCSLGKHTS